MPIRKMRSEKIILSFIAIVVGILVTGGAYYLYQNTKKVPIENSKTIVISKPSPTPSAGVFLSIKSPSDQSVISKKVVSIQGSTDKEATVVIVTPVDQQVLNPSSSGDFSTTVNIDDDQNFIEIIAISPEGEETRVVRTVTFSTEDF